MAHEHAIRVRYGETDKMGVAHHSVYALYFEEARTELMRSLGIPYADLEEEGVFLPLVEVGVRFLRGPRYDDLLVVESRVTELTHVRVRIEYRLLREGGEERELMAVGHTLHACTDARLRPRRLPGSVERVFRGVLAAPRGEEATRASRHR